MDRKPLNEASIDVWYEYNKSNTNVDLSNRIILIAGSHTLNDIEIEELNSLLDKEKELLDKAREDVKKNNRVSKRIHELLLELDEDERLQTIFSNVAISKFLDGDFDDEVDVEKSYQELREKDIDIHGHEELNAIYSNMLKDINSLDNLFIDDIDPNRSKCTVENCLYCTPPSEEEKQNAYDSLVGDGYFSMDAKDALTELMVIIHRYERLNKGFFDDVDDNDDEE